MALLPDCNQVRFGATPEEWQLQGSCRAKRLVCMRTMIYSSRACFCRRIAALLLLEQCTVALTIHRLSLLHLVERANAAGTAALQLYIFFSLLSAQALSQSMMCCLAAAIWLGSTQSASIQRVAGQLVGLKLLQTVSHGPGRILTAIL